MSLQRSLASSTPAMTGTFKAPKFHSRTGAVNHTGFPPLLTEMLTKAFGYKASPITWCSNHHPSLTFIALMQECTLA